MSKDVRNFSWIEITGIIILALAIIGSIIVYIVTLAKLPFARESADFGTFGDYVGGLVTRVRDKNKANTNEPGRHILSGDQIEVA